MIVLSTTCNEELESIVIDEREGNKHSAKSFSVSVSGRVPSIVRHTDSCSCTSLTRGQCAEKHGQASVYGTSVDPSRLAKPDMGTSLTREQTGKYQELMELLEESVR